MAHRVTGYSLREAIKQHTLKRDTAATMFSDTLRAFPDEKKPAPGDVMKTFLDAEDAIARLQTAQMRYNISVRVTIDGESLPLAAAVKLVGGVARAEKMWRSAATPKTDRFGYRDDSRDANTIVSVATITPQEAVGHATKTAKRSAVLRQAIAVANATEILIEDLDASLFE